MVEVIYTTDSEKFLPKLQKKLNINLSLSNMVALHLIDGRFIGWCRTPGWYEENEPYKNGTFYYSISDYLNGKSSRKRKLKQKELAW